MRTIFTACVVTAASCMALGCIPEDREPVLVGGDADADSPADADRGEDDAPTCDATFYPCGITGTGTCDILADHGFVPANDLADSLAAEDEGAPGGHPERVDLHDLYARAGVTAILLYGTAGWCTACEAESRALNDLYAALQDIDGTGNRAEFVAVVFEDDTGRPATREYAAAYASRYGFTFPAVADTRKDILRYFDASSTPGNIIVDATTMELRTVLQGFVEPSMRSQIEALDGSGAACEM